jgi:hypothetical protein
MIASPPLPRSRGRVGGAIASPKNHMKTPTTTGAGNLSAAHRANMTANQLYILRGIASREEAKARRDELVQKLRVECAGAGCLPRWSVEEVAALNLYLRHAL